MRQYYVPLALKTTTSLMTGEDDGFGADDASRKIARARAAAAGVNIAGKKYHPGLCPKKDAFSPFAWYGDEMEVKRKAEALGRNVHGSIEHHTPVRDADLAANERPYRVARRLVKPEVDAENRNNFGGKATKKQIAALYQKYQDKHSGNPMPAGDVKLTK
jgi:hypothetical protein